MRPGAQGRIRRLWLNYPLDSGRAGSFMRAYHMLEKAVYNNRAAAVLLPYCIYARDRYMLLRRRCLLCCYTHYCRIEPPFPIINLERKGSLAGYLPQAWYGTVRYGPKPRHIVAASTWPNSWFPDSDSKQLAFDGLGRGVCMLRSIHDDNIKGLHIESNSQSATPQDTFIPLEGKYLGCACL